MTRPPAPSAATVLAAVDRALGVAGAELHRAGDGRAARRVLLALEPGGLDPGDADLVVLHRPWDAVVPEGVAVIGCHEPLDAALGLDAPLAAAALGLPGHRPLAEKLALVDGPAAAVRARIVAAMGGSEREQTPTTVGPVDAPVVLASAMRPELVHAAAAAGAALYVTGQWRPGAEPAVAETGIGVLALGHARSERWALRVLADHLREALPGVEVDVAPAPRG